MNQEKIGKFIASLRKEKNLTQEQLATKLNISKNAVSKWERGICLMDMSLLKPLSEILDVSINEILNGEKISNKEFKEKADEVLTNTIKYSNKRISKIKKIIIICIITFVSLLFITTFSIDYSRVNNVIDIKGVNPEFMSKKAFYNKTYTGYNLRDYDKLMEIDNIGLYNIIKDLEGKIEERDNIIEEQRSKLDELKEILNKCEKSLK